MSGINLLLGKLHDAWRAWPDQKKVLAAFPPGPPIFISGTHRSGTTWVASMLAEPGLWYVHEPFNPNKQIWQEPFTYVPTDGEDFKVDALMASILAGGARSTACDPYCEHAWMPLRLFAPPVQRMMIKDPLACLLTGYLARKHALKTLVLFRHPAGFSASITRLGWPAGEFLNQFLNEKALMQNHLEPYRELMKTHRERDDLCAAAVLHGVLNTVLWRQAQENPDILQYQFESLCERPLEAFQEIFKALDLPYTEATRKRHTDLCFGGSIDPSDYSTHAVSRNSAAMAWSWREKISPESTAAIRAVWENFDLPLYRDDQEW